MKYEKPSIFSLTELIPSTSGRCTNGSHALARCNTGHWPTLCNAGGTPQTPSCGSGTFPSGGTCRNGTRAGVACSTGSGCNAGSGVTATPKCTTGNSGDNTRCQMGSYA